VTAFLKVLKTSSEDEVVRHYAIKTIENITSQCKHKGRGGGEKFCMPEFVQICLKLYKSPHHGIRNSALVSLANVCILYPVFAPETVRAIEIKNIFMQIQDSEKKTQQALLNLINLYLFYGGDEATREMFDYLKYTASFMISFLEHGVVHIKAKTLLTFVMLSRIDISLVSELTNGKFMQIIDKLSQEKNKYLKSVLKEFIQLAREELEKYLEIMENELPSIIGLYKDGNEDANEEEDEAERENQNEAIFEVFNSISVILTSEYVQECVITDEIVVKLFKFIEYYEHFSGRQNGLEVHSA
jgi:hypothetical protein